MRKENIAIATRAEEFVPERLTPRITALRDHLRRSANPYKWCSERDVIVTKGYQETEGEPILIRRAKILQKLLTEIGVYINDHELIVGRNTREYVGAILCPEADVGWIENELKIWEENRNNEIMMRPLPKIPDHVANDVKNIILPYWKKPGKTIKGVLYSRLPEEDKKFRKSLLYMENNDPGGLGRVMLDVRILLERGFKGIKESCEAKLSDSGKYDKEKRLYWEAVIIVCEAVREFAERYAMEADKLAKREINALRKAELEKIAGICRRIPWNPPRTFHEALQSIWFALLIALSEEFGDCIGPGRLDQVLMPYYKKDINEGFLTREEALELVQCFIIKGNETQKARPAAILTKFGQAGYAHVFHHITLGGQTVDGRDATNELSYLFLDAAEGLRLPRPQMSVRIHSKTPRRFLERAIEVVNRIGGGIPQFIGDNCMIQQLLGKGVSLQDARNYIMLGCSTGNCWGLFGHLHMGWFNFAKILNLLLNDGIDVVTGERMWESEDMDFTSFEALMSAFYEKLKYAIEIEARGIAVESQVTKEMLPHLYASILVPDCIEAGKDFTAGGAKYNWGATVTGVGLATAGDSLAAIKKVVFDEKLLTLDQLVKVLNRNFEGAENIRTQLLKAPKFGNDNDYVDEIVRQIANVFFDELEAHENPGFGRLRSELHSVTTHIPLGAATGATADGRKACEPLNTGLTPTNGRNVKGLTATMNSVAKVDQLRTNASSLTLQIMPTNFEGEGSKKFANLLFTYLTDLNALHVQYNFVSPELLREAQKEPEKYRDLVVRVAGFSVFFTEMSKKVQDDVIARTQLFAG